MTDRRYTQDYERAPLSSAVASLIAERMPSEGPISLARTLERHAHRLRAEAEDIKEGTKSRYTIENRSHMGPDFAVYDETGEEFLFHEEEAAIEFIRDGLAEERGEER